MKSKGSDKVLVETAGKIASELFKKGESTLMDQAEVALKAIGVLTVSTSEARKELEYFIRENLHYLGGLSVREETEK